jgi:cation transport protein ChaC
VAGPERWVFAYGSLMWQPGFAHRRAVPAVLEGYHRALCIKSVVYRGTPDAPGLVLGLQHGGQCEGVALEVDDAAWEEVLSSLREREQPNRVYVERWLAVLCDGGTVREALVFVADTTHAQYAGDLSEAETLHLLRTGRGSRGTAADYLTSTLAHLRALGIHDAALERVASLI